MNEREKIKLNNFNRTNAFFEKSDNFLSKTVGPYTLGTKIMNKEKLLVKELLERLKLAPINSLAKR